MSGPAAVVHERQKTRGGRPTRAAALERDERLLAIAADMFMEHGFDGTSMERLAETAMVGKATLYARYTDKGALFADVLRRRIMTSHDHLELKFDALSREKSLEATLRAVARHILDLSLAPGALALGRILAAQGMRFPELGQLAAEGVARQVTLVETILRRFSATHRYAIDDMPLLAELYLGTVLGRTSRLALLGVPVATDKLDRRIREAVALFIRGAVVVEP